MIDKYNMTGGELNHVINKYMPITINLQLPIKSIFDVPYDIKLNTNIDYPKFSSGFIHYYHSLQKDMDVLKQFENKKKVYNVINEFDYTIDNYENTIENSCKKYLNIKDKAPQIINTNFYKLWEILFMFDLFDINKSISTLNIEDDCGFLQSLILFRDKFSKATDKYFAVKSDKNSTIITNLVSGYNNKTIKLIDDKNIKDEFDLIISNIDIKVELYETLEQEYYKYLFKNIMTAIKTQKREGVFICKFYDTYTLTSIKFILILMSLYEKVFFSKPLTSKLSDPEKYIICINFKYHSSDKKFQEILKELEKLYSQAESSKLNIVDLFSSYEINKDILIRILQMNVVCGNNYFKHNGDIVSFINSQNYYGDKYQEYREKQIEGTTYWTKLFLPEIKDYNITKNKIKEISFLSNKINTDMAIKLEKTLI
jgi:hypothetical protein